MNVLFLNPPFHPKFSREQRSPGVTKSGTFYYPKWLSYAAGVAIKAGHNVDLIDAPAQQIDVAYIVDRIRTKSIQVLVSETSTPSIINDIAIIDAIKQKLPKIKTCLVGRHVSALPQVTMHISKNIDAIAIREYEYTIRDWLSALACGASLTAVDGIIWRDNNNALRINKAREPIKNLDELPFVTEVYRRFLHIPDYFYSHSLHPVIVLDSSRGCPYKCSFCVYPQTFSGHVVRYRSVDNVANEFDFIARELPAIKTVMLEDDTFIINKERTRLFAEELIRRNNKLVFDCNCRVDSSISTNLLKTLKQAGARLFCVGFESGDHAVISAMQKNLKSSKNITYQTDAEIFMNRCREAGIMVHGCFMVGNLNETQASMRATLDFAKRLNPDTAQFFPIMVYPGTKAYDHAKTSGLLTTEDFSKWLTDNGSYQSVIDLPDLPHTELVAFCDNAVKEFYLRPRYFAYKLKQSLTNKDEFNRNYYGFVSLLKSIFR